MLVDISQLIYFAIILGFGFLVLYLRRRAEGSKSFYKIILILSGVALFALIGGKLDLFVINNLANLLLITLAFELSMRVTPDNLKTPKPTIIFVIITFLNIVILGTLTSALLKIPIIHSIIFAIILSAIEYFMVDELRQEGDAANPLIILIAFGLIYLLGLKNDFLNNTADLIQYVLIGLGVGIFVSIIIFKLLKPHKITWVHELMLISAAYLTYLLTEYLNGFGLLAIMIFGLMFGNSYIRKKSEMNTFSPFIFKSLEILIFIMIGFIITLGIDTNLLWNALVIFLVYILIRLIVISIGYKKYSIQNKLLLTLAPKGVVFGAALLVFTSKNLLLNDLTIVMLYILVFSLLASWAMEYFEDQKIKKMDKFFDAIKNLRYGRKKNLKKHKHS
jgi:NhaP-type Na+/H+ or K+/H+ antiporter